MSLKRRKFIEHAGLALAGTLCFNGKSMAQTVLANRVRNVKVDPYRTVDWDRVQRHKANLHTHTTVSDGRMPPHQVVDEYHSRGYAVLALTDHNKVTYPWSSFDRWKTGNENRDPGTLGMLALSGNELSRHHHTLSLFSDFDSDSRDWDEVLTALGRYRQEVRGVVCHPAMHWPRQRANPGTAVHVPLAPALRRLSLGDFTIEAWFCTSDSGRNVLLGNYAGGRGGALNLELHTENRVRLFIQPSDGPVTDINLSAGDVNTRDGRWHHLAGVRRGGEAVLYLDGREIGRRADHSGAFELLGSEFFLGRDTRTGSTALKGDLGMVRLWGTGLTARELAALASGTAPDRLSQSAAASALLAEYRFERGGGAILDTGAFSGALDDTAGHSSGPFPAAAGSVALVAVRDAPVQRSLRFSTPEAAGLPENVPDDVIDWYADIFRRHGHLSAIEVSNGTRPLTEYPLDRALWDGLLARLMPHRPVWGLATDDMHSMAHLGRDWAIFLTSSLSEDAVRRALDSGTFVFATTRIRSAEDANDAEPPRVERIVHNAEAGRITVTATSGGRALPDAAYVWISMGRQVHSGPCLDYRSVANIGCYARAEIISSGGTAFINPYGFA